MLSAPTIMETQSLQMRLVPAVSVSLKDPVEEPGRGVCSPQDMGMSLRAFMRLVFSFGRTGMRL